METKRIAAGGAGSAGEPAEALYTGSGRCLHSEERSRQRAATEVAVALCSGSGELKPQGLWDARGRTLQATARESSIASCSRRHEGSASPEGAVADPGDDRSSLRMLPGTGYRRRVGSDRGEETPKKG